MALKDDAPSGSKDQLMKDLKSLKNALDEDDDNVPLLLEDEDIPVLANEDDDDIPVLDTPELPETDIANKASLEAALRQLESMELAPRSRKTASPPPRGIEDTIRANAAAPIISNEELTRVRENPFLNSNQKAQLDASRKLREEAQQAAKAAVSGQKPPPQKSAPMQEEAIDFTDNPFLKASTSLGGAPTTSAPSAQAAAAEEEDGSAEILKELGDEAKPYLPRAAIKAPAVEQKTTPPTKEEEGFGDIILEEDEPAPARHADPATAIQKKLQKKEIDLIVDEVVEEYIVILEAALRKKLKEKLPNLLK